jgi:hypothetical protein
MSPHCLISALCGHVEFVDGATLWIGLAGVVLGTISLTWQAVTFRLTGGRVVAHLRVGVRTPDDFITERAGRDWMRRLFALAAQHHGQPILLLVASNVGRMAVGVERAAVVLEGDTVRYWLRDDPANPRPGSSIHGLHGATWYAPLDPVMLAVTVQAKVSQDRRPRKVWMELELAAAKPVRTRETIRVAPFADQSPAGPAAG